MRENKIDFAWKGTKFISLPFISVVVAFYAKREVELKVLPDGELNYHLWALIPLSSRKQLYFLASKIHDKNQDPKIVLLLNGAMTTTC